MATTRAPKTLHLRAKRASTFMARFAGLMFKAGLPAEGALLLVPCRSVHTCFMRFPLDVVFLDADCRVVATIEHLLPWRFTAYNSRAYQVLELSSGAIARQDIQCGDTLSIS